jgi:hypothetical protein
MWPGQVMVSMGIRHPCRDAPGAERSLHDRRIQTPPTGCPMTLNTTDSDVLDPSSLRICFRGVPPGMTLAPVTSSNPPAMEPAGPLTVPHEALHADTRAAARLLLGSGKGQRLGPRRLSHPVMVRGWAPVMAAAPAISAHTSPSSSGSPRSRPAGRPPVLACLCLGHCPVPVVWRSGVKRERSFDGKRWPWGSKRSIKSIRW